MRLVVAGEKDSTPTVAFRLEQDADDVNVYANDVRIGWFEDSGNGKVRFATSYISDSTADVFERDTHGQLATI